MRSGLVCVLVLLTSPYVRAQDSDLRAPFTIAVQGPDGTPIAGASVLLGDDRGAAADADGEARFEDVAPGRYVVRVSYVGRRSRQLRAVLNAPGPWGLIVELAEEPSSLGDVVVTARDLSGTRLAADGFFEREALGGGTILTADGLHARNPVLLTDAVRGVLGVSVRPGGLGYVATSTRSGGECTLSVYLDGVYSPALTDNLDGLSAQDIVAVEVYRGPSQTPIQYNRIGQSNGCGVILVWTTLSIAKP